MLRCLPVDVDILPRPVPPDEWRALNAAALVACETVAPDWDAVERALLPLQQATGIAWAAPMEDGMPAEPAERDHARALADLPRRTRRRFGRATRGSDACGALEVLDALQDCDLERRVTGEDRTVAVLEALLEAPFGDEVRRLIEALLDLATHGCDVGWVLIGLLIALARVMPDPPAPVPPRCLAPPGRLAAATPSLRRAPPNRVVAPLDWVMTARLAA